jgi:hypothetical protein
VKRISAEAYQALREALALIFWNKRPFESYLRTALRDHPELLAGLNFGELKRKVADSLVDRLVEREDDLQKVTLNLMLEVASMEQFPNIELIKDEQDRVRWLDAARRAVEHLRKLTDRLADLVSDQERAAAEREARRAQDEAQRSFTAELDRLRMRFLQLQSESDAKARGHALEPLLTDLFVLFDMEPRLAYSLEREQIDGSLSSIPTTTSSRHAGVRIL